MIQIAFVSLRANRLAARVAEAPRPDAGPGDRPCADVGVASEGVPQFLRNPDSHGMTKAPRPKRAGQGAFRMHYAFLVSQKMVAISSILASS